MTKYVGNKKASEILGVSRLTLYEMEKKGQLETIRTPGGKRLYNVEKFINAQTDNKQIITITQNINKKNICYCRVSTRNQKDDLERQIKYMSQKFPTFEIISDIGSGLNFNRKGLNKIIDYAIKGQINKLAIAYRDRLCRFGYEMIENIINKYSNGEIIILNELNLSPEQELTKDLVQIMNVFSARMNGLRKYKKEINNVYG